MIGRFTLIDDLSPKEHYPHLQQGVEGDQRIPIDDRFDLAVADENDGILNRAVSRAVDQPDAGDSQPARLVVDLSAACDIADRGEQERRKRESAMDAAGLAHDSPILAWAIGPRRDTSQEYCKDPKPGIRL